MDRTTEYKVLWADFDSDPDPTVEKELSLAEWLQLPEKEPNSEIDDRTVRVKLFASEEEAVVFAKDKLAANEKWRAYVLVQRIESETIFKLK